MRTFQAKAQLSGHFILTSVDLNDPAYGALRATGHEFVLVGVTRGDPRGNRKPLNPASAADLEDAIMGLDLNEPAGSALEGVRDWTWEAPVNVCGVHLARVVAKRERLDFEDAGFHGLLPPVEVSQTCS